LKPLSGLLDGAERDIFQVISLGLFISIVSIFTRIGSGHPSPQVRVLLTVMESPVNVPQSGAFAGDGVGVGVIAVGVGDGIGVVVVLGMEIGDETAVG
jgi:hypothetical protein